MKSRVIFLSQLIAFSLTAVSLVLYFFLPKQIPAFWSPDFLIFVPREFVFIIPLIAILLSVFLHPILLLYCKSRPSRLLARIIPANLVAVLTFFHLWILLWIFIPNIPIFAPLPIFSFCFIVILFNVGVIYRYRYK